MRMTQKYNFHNLCPRLLFRILSLYRNIYGSLIDFWQIKSFTEIYPPHIFYWSFATTFSHIEHILASHNNNLGPRVNSYMGTCVNTLFPMGILFENGLLKFHSHGNPGLFLLSLMNPSHLVCEVVKFLVQNPIPKNDRFYRVKVNYSMPPNVYCSGGPCSHSWFKLIVWWKCGRLKRSSPPIVHGQTMI